MLAAIGAPTLTIAIVNLIFEPYARNAIAEDIQAMLGREERVIETGLQDMLDARTHDVASIVGTSASVTVLPWHPTQWADREFRPLCELAHARKLVLRVFTPLGDSEALTTLARRLGVDTDELCLKLASLPDDLCAAWDDIGAHDESTLEVWTYPGLPAVGLLASNSVVALDIGPSVRRNAFDGSSQLSLFAPDSVTAHSIRDQLSAIEEAATRGGVRPLHVPEPRGGTPHALEPTEAASGRLERATDDK